MQNGFDLDFSSPSDNRFIWGNKNCPYLKRKTTVNEKASLTVKAMNLETDILSLHAWVNMPYSAAFWGMDHSTAPDIQKYYSDMIRSNTSYPFMVYCNNLPVAFFELYDISKDAVRQYVEHPKDAIGLHLLMAPPKYILTKLSFKIPKLSSEVLRFILVFTFSFTGVENIYAEPDIRNIPANRLAAQCGFTFLKQISLPDKTANLYIFPRSRFEQSSPMQTE